MDMNFLSKTISVLAISLVIGLALFTPQSQASAVGPLVNCQLPDNTVQFVPALICQVKNGFIL